MKVLTGILVDVSYSMKENVDNRSVGRRGGSWVKSIFEFIDRLITHDASPDQQLFVIGFGASCQQVTFDVLTTLKTLENRPTGRSKRNMLEEGIMIVETNGAPRLRKWATTDEIDAEIDEWQTSIMLHMLKNNQQFRHRFIYECLPDECREVQHRLGSYGKEAVNFVASVSTYAHQKLTRNSVKDVIDRGMNLARDYILAKVTSTAVHSIKNASENVRGPIVKEKLTEERTNELYERVKPYIYGTTPLMQSVGTAVELFRENMDQQYKLLCILSDGIPTDGQYLRSKQLVDLNVTVVCCYISPDSIAEPRRLYSSERRGWTDGAKFMFRMSSAIPTQKIPRTLFVKKGWKIDIDNNETRMFFQINHPDIIDEVCDLAKNCVCSHDSLADVLSSVSLDLYINRANEGFSPKTQEGKTCYAVASATVMHLAMKRIVGREGDYPDFYEIRDELIDKYGKHSANVGEVLEDVCPKYRLRYQKLDERGASSAIVEKRPVVAIFQLSASEWRSFYTFYHRNPRGILTREVLNITMRQHGEKLIGHAVVLTSFNSQSLRLMNSKGDDWANGGFFRIQNAAVLGLRFYDIFWNEEDLLPSEKAAYRRDGADISAKLMKSLTSLQTATYKCPRCSVESYVSEFKGHLLKTECPRCRETFNANVAGSDLALNIYLTSLLSSDTV